MRSQRRDRYLGNPRLFAVTHCRRDSLFLHRVATSPNCLISGFFGFGIDRATQWLLKDRNDVDDGQYWHDLAVLN
jgi:hypothetical protein